MECACACTCWWLGNGEAGKGLPGCKQGVGGPRHEGALTKTDACICYFGVGCILTVWDCGLQANQRVFYVMDLVLGKSAEEKKLLPLPALQKVAYNGRQHLYIGLSTIYLNNLKYCVKYRCILIYSRRIDILLTIYSNNPTLSKT